MYKPLVSNCSSMNMAVLLRSTSSMEGHLVDEEASSDSGVSLYSPCSSPHTEYDSLGSTSRRTSGYWSESSTISTTHPIIEPQWSLVNCDEHWMRIICPGLQTIRWKSFCWFQVRGVTEEEKLRFVEIYPCAGRQDVLEVNGSFVREPRRLYAGDIICVVGTHRWEVRNDIALINVD